MINEVTRKYKDENGDEHEVTGADISKFPNPQEHEFYQEGRHIKCECHPGVSKALPAGKNLYKEQGGYVIR